MTRLARTGAPVRGGVQRAQEIYVEDRLTGLFAAVKKGIVPATALGGIAPVLSEALDEHRRHTGGE